MVDYGSDEAPLQGAHFRKRLFPLIVPTSPTVRSQINEINLGFNTFQVKLAIWLFVGEANDFGSKNEKNDARLSP